MTSQIHVEEYIMILKTLSASAILLSIFTTNALAAIAVCPSASSITQKKEEQGYSYSAPGPNGRLWVGENPIADEGDLETFVFTGALYRTVSSEGNGDVVSCDYEGKEWNAFARMTLYSFRGWAPVNGTKWKPQPVEKKASASHKANYVEQCDSRDQKECEFNYKFLTTPPTGH
jgi:hypothetical protein